MKVSYLTPFYSAQCDGRFGRFHDWVHALRDMHSPPFDFYVHTPLSAGSDSTLVSEPITYLGSGDDLWAARRNSVERLFNLPRLRRDLRRVEPDVVHMVSVDPILQLAIRSTVDDVPLVVGPNIGGWFPNRRDNIWFSRAGDRAKLVAQFHFRKALVRAIDPQQVLAFSNYHREMLRHIDIPLDLSTVLPPGVDERFSPAESTGTISGPPELLYVGDLSEHKGYNLFLRAVSRLDSQIRVRIIGSGDPKLPLIRSLGLSESISIEGFVDRADLPPYYQQADLVAVPSIDEMGPNTQVEALATGTPLVTTDSSGLNEYPPPGTAELFWPPEVNALAKAIDRALENLESLSSSARAHAPEFTVSSTVSHLNELYRSLL